MSAHDRLDQPLAVGDQVEGVHFGEHHTFTVEEIGEEHGLPYVRGRVSIRLPAGAVRKVESSGRTGGKTATRVREGRRGGADQPSLPVLGEPGAEW